MTGKLVLKLWTFMTVPLRPRQNLELFMGRTKLRELKKNYHVEKVSTATSRTSFQRPRAKRLTQKYPGIADKTWAATSHFRCRHFESLLDGILIMFLKTVWNQLRRKKGTCISWHWPHKGVVFTARDIGKDTPPPPPPKHNLAVIYWQKSLVSIFYFRSDSAWELLSCQTVC